MRKKPASHDWKHMERVHRAMAAERASDAADKERLAVLRRETGTIDDYVVALIEWAEDGNTTAAGELLARAGAYLELGASMPEALQIYIASKLTGAALAFQDRMGKSGREVGIAVAGALNLLSKRGRRADRALVVEELRRAMEYAIRRDRGLPDLEALGGAADACGVSEETIRRAVQRLGVTKKG